MEMAERGAGDEHVDEAMSTICAAHSREIKKGSRDIKEGEGGGRQKASQTVTQTSHGPLDNLGQSHNERRESATSDKLSRYSRVREA